MAISAPTIINAAEVTSTEITFTSGEKNIATKKQAAMTTDVKPVRPPTAIPADDSTLVAGVDVPKIAPMTPAAESASKPLPMSVLFHPRMRMNRVFHSTVNRLQSYLYTPRLRY